MTVYGREVREHLSKEEIVVNLMECAVHLAEQYNDNNVIELSVNGAKITLNVDFSGVQEE